MKFSRGLINEETGEKRLVFQITHPAANFVVAKVWPQPADYRSVKFWKGDFHTVRKYWKTQKDYQPTANELEDAKLMIRSILTTPEECDHE